MTAALQNAKRTILQFFRTPQLLMLGTVQGALFLFMFRYIFGGAIHPGGGLDYVDFLVPGFLVTGILWLGMPASSGVAEDATTGVHDRLRSLPIPRSSVMFGRSIADTALTLWGLFVAGVLAFIVGFRLHADALDVVLALALLVVAAYSFSWIFITIGLVSSSAQAANGMATLLVIPVAFISAAYVPADSLPGWMQPVADNQPFTILSNALRSLTLGGTDAVGLGHTHDLLGGAEPRVVRRHLPGVQHDRGVEVRPPALTPRRETASSDHCGRYPTAVVRTVAWRGTQRLREETRDGLEARARRTAGLGHRPGQGVLRGPGGFRGRSRSHRQRRDPLRAAHPTGLGVLGRVRPRHLQRGTGIGRRTAARGRRRGAGPRRAGCAGVEVSDVEVLPWGSFVHFRDPDGNAWSVQQLPPR